MAWTPKSFVAEEAPQGPAAPMSQEPAAEGTDIDALVASTASKYGLEPGLVSAVIKHESNGNPNARSKTGATGLMQLTRGTARDMGLKVNKDVDERLDPAKNVDAGTRYLAAQLEEFDGNIELALAAYNRGPGAVKRAKGVPKANALNDTPRYVQRIMADYQLVSTGEAPAVGSTEAAAESPAEWVPSSFTPASREERAPRMGAMEAGGRGIAEGVTFGFYDELAGGLTAGIQKLRGDEGSFGELYTAGRDKVRARQEAAGDQHKGAYIAGQIGGAVATAPLLAGKAIQGASLGARLLTAGKIGAGYGAVAGAGASEGETVGEIAEDVAKGAAFGAATGGALTGAGAALGAAGRAVGQTAVGQAVSRAGRDLDFARMGGERVVRKLANGFDDVIDYARQSGVIPKAMEWGFRSKVAANVQNLLVREGKALEATRASLRGIGVTTRTARNFLLRVRDQVDKIKRIPSLKEGPNVTTGRRVQQGATATQRTSGSTQATVSREASGVMGAEARATMDKAGNISRTGKGRMGVEESTKVGVTSKVGVAREVVETAKDVTTTNIREVAHEAEMVHRHIRRAIQKVVSDAGELGAEQIYFVKKMLQDGKLYNSKNELVPLTDAGKKVMYAWLHELKQLERTFIEEAMGPQGRTLQAGLNQATHNYSLAADLSKLDKAIIDRRGQWWGRIWRAQLPGTIIGAAGGGVPGYIAATVAPPAIKGALTRAPAVGRAIGRGVTAAAPGARALTARYAGEAAVND